MHVRPYLPSLTMLVALLPTPLLAADDGVDVHSLEPATLAPMTGGGFHLQGSFGATNGGLPLSGNGYTLESGYWGIVTNYSYAFAWSPAGVAGSFLDPSNWSVPSSGTSWLPGEADVLTLSPPSGGSNGTTINLLSPTSPICVAVGGMQVNKGEVTFALTNATLELVGIGEPSAPSLSIVATAAPGATLIFDDPGPSAPGTSQLIAASTLVDSASVSFAGKLFVTDPSVSMLNLADVTVGKSRVGELRIEGGATATTGGNAWVGVGPLSQGTCTVRNPGSRWRIEGDFLELGGLGKGFLTAQSGATVELATELFALGAQLGNAAGIGTATIDDVGTELSIESGSLVIGEAGIGTLRARQGSHISSGTLNDVVLGQGPSADGTFLLDTGATAAITSPRLIAGDSGAGHLSVLNGSHLTTAIVGSNPSVVLGSEPGSLGEATLAQGSTWTILGSQLFVGSGGSGAIHLAGGTLTASTVKIGQSSVVDGFGTIVGTARNAGLLQPTPGGSISIVGDFSQVSLAPTAELAGQLVIETVSAAGPSAPSLVCSGDVDLAGGLTIRSPGSPPAEGTQLTVVTGGQSLNAAFDVVFVDGVPDLKASVQYPTADSQGADSVTVTFEALPGSAGLGDQSTGTIDFVPVDAALGDIDANGQSDLLLAYPASATGGNTGLIQAIPNLHPKGGTIESGTPIPVSAGVQLSAIATGDIDGDGRDDVVATDGMLAGGLVALVSDGTSLQPWPGKPFPPLTFPTAVTTADLNGDTIADILVACGAPGTAQQIFVFTSASPGVFSTQTIALPPETLPCFFATADVDGDADIDFAVSLSGADLVSVYLNDGDGAFCEHSAVDVAVGAKPMRIALQDLDAARGAAGRPDIVTLDQLGGTISVALNQTVAAAACDDPLQPLLFSSAVALPIATARQPVASPQSFAFLDKDEDGDLDIVVAIKSGLAYATRTLRNDFAGGGVSLNAGGEDPESAGTRLVLGGDLDADLVDDLLRIATSPGATDLLVPNASMAIAPNVTRQSILGDLDGNGTVDAADLAILLGAWGLPSPDADLDGSGIVDGADIAILLGAWGNGGF